MAHSDTTTPDLGSTSSEATIWSGKRQTSVQDLNDRAARAASGFRSMGVSEGECIALFLRNDFAFFEASSGAKMAGIYPVPINWHSTAEEAGYILKDCGAKALVIHEDLYSQIEAGIPAGLKVLVVPTPEEICEAYRIADWRQPSGEVQEWYEWLGGFSPISDPADATSFAVIYTSGTTGHPKGVKKNVIKTPVDINRRTMPYGLDTPGEKVVLMNGPMYHSAPNSYASLALGIGCSIVLQPRFDAEEMLALIETYRVTHMHIVPTMFVRMLKLPPEVRERYDLSSLTSVIHGAAPCPFEVKKEMIEWWGPVINEYYGSTETGLVARNTSEDALRKPGSVGKALPNAQLKIYDDEGHELGTGEIGDIYARSFNSPDFTYIGDDEKRRGIGRGELVTVGDVGYLDEEGYLYLCDRKRDMIISGGVNIYPAEIEAALVAIPGIKDCAVFGIPHEEFGETICAYVELMAGVDLDADAIKEKLGRHISKFKIPRVVKIVDSLPREDSGKIFKRKLREPYWADRGRVI